MAEIPLFTGQVGSLPTIRPESSVERLDPSMYGAGAEAGKLVPSVATSISQGIQGAVKVYQQGEKFESEQRESAATTAALEEETRLAPYKMEAAYYTALAARTKAETDAQLAPQLARIELSKAESERKRVDSDAAVAQLKIDLENERTTKKADITALMSRAQKGEIETVLPELFDKLPDLMGSMTTKTSEGRPMFDPEMEQMIVSLPARAQKTGKPEVIQQAQEFVARVEQGKNTQIRARKDLEGSAEMEPTGAELPPTPQSGAEGAGAPNASGDQLPEIDPVKAADPEERNPGGLPSAIPGLSLPDFESIKKEMLSTHRGRDLTPEGLQKAINDKMKTLQEQLPNDAQRKEINQIEMGARSSRKLGLTAEALYADLEDMRKKGQLGIIGPGSTMSDMSTAVGLLRNTEASTRLEGIKKRMDGLSAAVKMAMMEEGSVTASTVNSDKEGELIKLATISRDIPYGQAIAYLSTLQGRAAELNDRAEVVTGMLRDKHSATEALIVSGDYARRNPGTAVDTLGVGKHTETYPAANTKRYSAQEYLNFLKTGNIKARDARTNRVVQTTPSDPHKMLEGVPHVTTPPPSPAPTPESGGAGKQNISFREPTNEPHPGVKRFQQALQRKISTIDPKDIPEVHSDGPSEAWVLRHVDVESSGNPFATNKKSTAKGLGGLLDGTGKELWGKLGYGKTLGEYDPFNAPANMRMTYEYLAEKLDSFGGNTRLASAAYMLGEGEQPDGYGGDGKVPGLRKIYRTLKENGDSSPSWEKVVSHMPAAYRDKAVDYVAKIMKDEDLGKHPKLPPGFTMEHVYSMLPSEESRQAAHERLSPQAKEDMLYQAVATRAEHVKGTPLYDFAAMLAGLNPLRGPDAVQAEELPTKSAEEQQPYDIETGQPISAGQGSEPMSDEEKSEAQELIRSHTISKRRKELEEDNSKKSFIDRLATKVTGVGNPSDSLIMEVNDELGDEEARQVNPENKTRELDSPSWGDFNPFRGPEDAGAENPDETADEGAVNEAFSSGAFPSMTAFQSTTPDERSPEERWDDMVGGAQAMLIGASRQAMFGFDDDLAAELISYREGIPHDQALARVDAARKQLSEKYPGYYASGSVLGAVVQGGPLVVAGKALKGVGLLKDLQKLEKAGETVSRVRRVGEMAKEGAVIGSLAGGAQRMGEHRSPEGATPMEKIEGTLKAGAEGATQGAIVGAVVGTTSGAVINYLKSNAAKNIMLDVQDLVKKRGTAAAEGAAPEAALEYTKAEAKLARRLSGYNEGELKQIYDHLSKTDNEAASMLDGLTGVGNPKQAINTVAKIPGVSDNLQRTADTRIGGEQIPGSEEVIGGTTNRVRASLRKKYMTADETAAETAQANRPTDQSGIELDVAPRKPNEVVKESLTERASQPKRNETMRETLKSHGDIPDNPEDASVALANQFGAKEEALKLAREKAARPLYEAGKAKELADLRTYEKTQGQFQTGSHTERRVFFDANGNPIEGEALVHRHNTLRNQSEPVPGYQYGGAVEEVLNSDPLVSEVARRMQAGAPGRHGTYPINSFDVLQATKAELYQQATAGGSNAKRAGEAFARLRGGMRTDAPTIAKADDSYFEGSGNIRAYLSSKIKKLRDFGDVNKSKNINDLVPELLGSDTRTIEQVLENFPSRAERKAFRDAVVSHIQQMAETQTAGKPIPDFTKYRKPLTTLLGSDNRADALLRDVTRQAEHFKVVQKLSEAEDVGANLLSMQPGELKNTIKQLTPKELDDARGAVRDSIVKQFEDRKTRIRGNPQVGLDFLPKKENLQIIYGHERGNDFIKTLNEEFKISASMSSVLTVGSPTTPMAGELGGYEKLQRGADFVAQGAIKGWWGVPQQIRDVFAIIKGNPAATSTAKEMAEILIDKKRGIKFLKTHMEQMAKATKNEARLKYYNAFVDAIAQDPARVLAYIAAKETASAGKGAQGQEEFRGLGEE